MEPGIDVAAAVVDAGLDHRQRLQTLSSLPSLIAESQEAPIVLNRTQELRKLPQSYIVAQLMNMDLCEV